MTQYRFITRPIVVMLFLAIFLVMPFVASASAKSVQDFFERSWGTQPGNFLNSRYMVKLDEDLAVYTADVDLLPLLGSVMTASKPRLIFSQKEGLVQVRSNIDFKRYNQVEEYLKQLLGEPKPIIYERMIADDTFEERTRWMVGKNTQIILVSHLWGASIEVSKREFILPQKSNFENLFDDALLKQAREYEEQNQILEASSIYQELLNEKQEYHSFTPMVYERLAQYSQHKDAVDYLAKDSGFRFTLLKNLFSSDKGQWWIRIDFDAVAQEELKRKWSDEVKGQNDLTDLHGVLCRVQMDAVKGKYIVVEQIWLDSSNQMIGSRGAGLSQETGWPAAALKQVCEDFLEKWFSIKGF